MYNIIDVTTSTTNARMCWTTWADVQGNKQFLSSIKNFTADKLNDLTYEFLFYFEAWFQDYQEEDWRLDCKGILGERQWEP